MVSLFENNRSFRNIRVWILDDKISECGKTQLTNCANQYGREIHFLNVDNFLSIIKQTGAMIWGNSYSTYSRLFIADILESFDIKRVIYCDSDLIIDNSLREIWEWELGEYVLGGVKEYNRVEIRDLLGLSRSASYFQAGFLLIDIEKWKEKKCTERILDHMKNKTAKYPFVDQDLINCVLHNEICTLPVQYNVNPRAMQFSYNELTFIYGLRKGAYYTEEEFNAGLRNGNGPIIYHCSDPCGGKPWQEGNHHIFAEKWDYYYQKSMWSKLYKKTEYNPIWLAKIQYFLYRYLPHCVYIIFLAISSKWAMCKIVKRFSL